MAVRFKRMSAAKVLLGSRIRLPYRAWVLGLLCLLCVV